MAKVQDILEIQDTRVIVRYLLLGKPSGQKSACRSLLVSLEKSEMSSWYHRKSVKSKDSFLINPDLWKMQNEANFLREAKQRKENKPSQAE